MWPDGYLQATSREAEGRRRSLHVAEGGPARLGVRLRPQRGHASGPGRATLAVAAANTPKAAASLTDVFAYGAAQQEGVLDLIKDKELISIFSLDDPTAFEPPRAWFEQTAPEPAGVRGGRRGGEGSLGLARRGAAAYRGSPPAVRRQTNGAKSDRGGAGRSRSRSRPGRGEPRTGSATYALTTARARAPARLLPRPDLLRRPLQHRPGTVRAERGRCRR